MKSENQISWQKNTVKNVCHQMVRDRQRQRLLFSSLEKLSDMGLPSEADKEVGQTADMLEDPLYQSELELLRRYLLYRDRQKTEQRDLVLPESCIKKH